MTNRIRPAIYVIAAVSLLQACSWFKDKPAEYLQSDEGRQLQVPEDLDAPRPVNAVVIGVEGIRAPSGDELNPMPPRAAVTAGGGDTNAYLAWSAAGAYLAVKDSNESVARRLRFAIQRSGMNLLEIHPQGAHRFEYRHVRAPVEKGFFEKFLFWRDNLGPDYSGTYRVRMEDDGAETRVYLESDSGAPAQTNAVEHVLGIFMERLG